MMARTKHLRDNLATARKYYWLKSINRIFGTNLNDFKLSTMTLDELQKK